MNGNTKQNIGTKLLYSFVLAVFLGVCSVLGLAYQRQADELALTQAHITELTTSVIEANELLADVQTELTSKNTTMEIVVSERDLLQESLDSLTADIIIKQAELGRLQELLSNSEGDNGELTNQITQLESEISIIQGNINTITTELEDANAEISRLQNEVIRLNELVNAGLNTINLMKQSLWSYSVIETLLDQTYTGEAITPTIAVSVDSYVFDENNDYTVAYSNNTNVGTATVTVNSLLGSSLTSSFNIVAEETQALDFVFYNNILTAYIGTNTNVEVPSSYSLGEVVRTVLITGMLDYTMDYNSYINDSGYTATEANQLILDYADMEIMSISDGYAMEYMSHPEISVIREASCTNGIVSYSIIASQQLYVAGNDYAVTEIATNAFEYEDTAVNIVLDSSVVTLNLGSFQCANLSTISLLSSTMVNFNHQTSTVFHGNGVLANTVVFNVPVELLATYQSSYSFYIFEAIS